MQNLGTRLDAPNNMWARLGEFRQAPIIITIWSLCFYIIYYFSFINNKLHKN